MLDDLLVNGRLKRHRPAAAETRDLLAVADRHLKDASLSELSDDGRFTAAYGAVLALATIVIGASATRPTTSAGAATAAEAEALIEAAAEFRQDVLEWLESNHPLLAPG